MDYPINLMNKSLGGFAKADNEDQHKALSEQGYEPAWKAPEAGSDDAAAAAAEILHTVDSLRAQLDAAGIAYDKRFGVDKLKALLPAQE